MAEFSKQYCEKKDPDFSWDFDILEVASRLAEGEYLPYICEGYGFIAIGKAGGEIILAFRVAGKEEDEAVWKTFNDVVV
jgi:hypothetical protein